MRTFLSAVILSTTCMFCFRQEKPITSTIAWTTSTLLPITTLTTEAGAVTPASKDLFLANRIPPNSKVYIADFQSDDVAKPVEGFEVLMTAAIRKKGVPVIIVADRTLADFEINGSEIIRLVKMMDAGWAMKGFSGGSPGAIAASLTVTNLLTGIVAYNNSSQRPIPNKSLRSTTEEMAKYLKRKIVDDEKKFVNLYPGPHHAPRDLSKPQPKIVDDEKKDQPES